MTIKILSQEVLFIYLFCKYSLDQEYLIQNEKYTIIIDAFMGVVLLSPSKKKSWLMAIPNNEQTNNLLNSFFSIF
jgi:hypothetical protein